MRKRRHLSIPILLALACCLPVAAGALQINLNGYDRAFSPNGDGLQDESAISFTVLGDGDGIDSLFLAIYASAEIPPQEADLLRVLHSAGDAGESVGMGLSWDGRDDGAAMLPDDFYYLQLFAAAGDTSAWLSPATQLELNSSGPGDVISIALEPADFFLPLSPGESEFLELRFIAPDFDPATDSATGLIVSYNETSGVYEQVDTISLDPGWSAVQGADTAYRLLWDGGLAANGEIVDGWFGARFSLSDDAGNPPSALVSTTINLDALAPTLEVASLGDYEEGTVFHFRPEDIPATIDILASDRNSAFSCSLAIVDQDNFAVAGTLLESDTEAALFRFELPSEEWAAEGDSSYYLFFSAADSAGNRTRALGAPKKISLIADETAPPTPSWDMPRTEFVQAGVLLRGNCAEVGVDVHIFLDGEYVDEAPVDSDNVWQYMAAAIFHDQEEAVTGTHEWTAYAVDPAGNVSAAGASILLTYTPGPTLQIPGRWYGRDGEAFELNSNAPATLVKIRIYSVDGRLLRILETDNAVDETDFYLSWDLNDEEGRPLMDGLYIVNIACTLKSGELTHERKVVAIVRD